MDSEIIAAFVGPVFTAMLAGAGILIKSMQVRHREQSARARDLEVATRTVDFINTYLQAQDKVLPRAEQDFVRERAMRDLEVAYQTMMATANADYHDDSSGAWIRVIKRALLIGLNRTAAKVVRVFFYIFTAINVVLFGAWMGSVFTDPELQGDITLMIFVIVFGVVLLLLPIVLLYLWARWLDRDRSATTPPVPSVTDPMLGHYGNWDSVANPGPNPMPNPMPNQTANPVPSPSPYPSPYGTGPMPPSYPQR